uniref:Endosomal transmembrane epsin interactor 1 n=1 Tax=Aquila chrysaetos chrysaetos TaxID=223781 RepID=A0A663FDX8_AQUCH
MFIVKHHHKNRLQMLASNVILLPHIYRLQIRGTKEFCRQDSPPPYEAVQRQHSSEQVWPTGEQTAPAWVLHRVTTFSSVGSSLHRSTGPARSLLQCRLPTGSQPPSGIHLLQHGVFHGLQVDICSTVDLCGLQGDRAVLSCEAATQAKLKLELCTVILQKSLRPRALAVTGFEIQCLTDNKIYTYIKQLVAQNLKQSSGSMSLDIRELVENTKSLLKSDEKHMAEAITSATFFEQVMASAGQAMSLCTRVLPFRQHPGLLYLESCGDLNTFTTDEDYLAGVVRETVF